MAQLKDLIVMGAARFIGDIYASSIQTDKIKAPTASNGTTFGIGANGKVLKSNGTTIYWGDDNNTTYTLAGLMGSTAKGSSTNPIYWTGSAFNTISSYGGNSASASILKTYEARASTTNLNKPANFGGVGAVLHLIASSSTTTGKSPTDANILQMNWDNDDGYDSQLGISTSENRMYFRSQASAGTAWQEVAHAPSGTAIGSTSQPVYLDATGVISPVTAIANTYLANSKITIAGHEISLGESLAADTLVSSLGLSSALRFIGVTTTVLEDNATTSSITIDGTTISSLKAGDVVFYNDKEFAWTGSKWEFLGGESSFKIVQTAKTDPTASGTGISYIATISQDTNGVITATKSTVRDASATQSGIVTTEAQIFAGDKTFNNHLYLNGIADSVASTTSKLIFGNSSTIYADISCSTAGLIGFESQGHIIGFSGSSNSFRPLNGNTTASLGTASYKWANVYATTFTGSLTGNAATATTLQNARTFTIGNTGKTFNGSANVSWTTDEIGALNLTGGTVTGPTSFTTSVNIDDLTTGNLLVNGIATFNNTINGTIASANALTSNAGSEIQPIYFENGIPKAGTVIFDNLNVNRLMWTRTANKPYAGYHYANSTKIAINSSSEPTENFYVNGNVRFAIGTNDDTAKKRFVIGSSENRYLSFGGAGIQAYNADDTSGILYLQYNGGSLKVGSSSASVTGTLYGTYTFLTSKGFNYSGIELGSDDAFRPVWFSYNGQTGTPVYDNDFKYNPSSNTLYILNLSTPSSTAMYVKPASTLYLTTTSASPIIFTNNNVESARFNPSGSLRLGDTSADNTDKLYVNGSTTITGNIKSGGNLILYNGLDADRFLIFDYNNDSSAGASWRIGSLNSGSGDANYFTIQTGGSDTAATIWNNAIRIGMNTLDSAFGGNVYPSVNNVKTLGTNSYKWADVYAITLHGALDGNAATATALSATIDNNRLPVRLQEYHTSAMTLDSTICGWYYATSGGPFEIFHSSNKDYLVMNQGYSNTWGTQIATDFRSNRLAVRNKNNGTWSSWTKVLDQNTGVARAHYARTTSTAGYILIKITKLTNWMLSFTLRLYQNYNATDLLISGYNYGTNYWFAPKAIILGSTNLTSIEVKFGHTTTAYDLWLAVPASSYTGADIFGACNGHTQIDLDGAFDISFVTELPESLQTIVTAYRPWYRDEILPIANGGTNANTAPRARANLGLGNAKIYYGTCATAAATAAKVVVCADYPSSPTIGDIVIVTFSNANSAAVESLTLNVNSSGAKSIKYMYNNAVNYIPDVGYLLAQTYIFHYDGTNWVIDNMHQNTNTTYSAMSVAEMKTGTATSSRTIRADYLKTFLSTLAGTGLSLTHDATNGVVLNHSNSITAGTVSDGGSTRTLAFGGTFKIPSVTYDAQGHITSTTTITLTMPIAPSSNTAGSTNKTDTKLFLIGAETQGANPQTYSNSNVYISTNNVLVGAAWNDYAEYRKADIIEPGRCVIEKGNDELMISSQRLQRGAEIISDTFGFAIGETNECQTPIAVAGRVLAYGYEDRQEFKTHIGYPVCSGPNGTVSIMTEEEEKQYPSRIIGFISAVPEYQEWGSKKIKVNNRIWIRIK